MTEKIGEINIMIIEDEAIVAMDLEQRLLRLGYGVSGIYGRSEKAINFLKIHTPDLILCDINIKGAQDGIEIAEFVNKEKKIPLIFVTALSDKKTLERAKTTLPYGYIVKPYEDSDLKSAIEIARYKSDVESDKLLLTKEKIASLCHEPLSQREYETVQDIVKGLSNTEITTLRYISINTVKYHVSNVFKKMNVNSRAEVLHKILTLFTNDKKK